MNKLLLIILIVVGLSSCSKTENNSMVSSKWKLVSVYNDPGDGSGDYVEVDYNKVIEFKEDNTVLTDYTFCYVPSNVVKKATYTDNKIMVNCDGIDFTIEFQKKDGDLYLFFPCIETCGERYVKVQ